MNVVSIVVVTLGSLSQVLLQFALKPHLLPRKIIYLWSYLHGVWDEIKSGLGCQTT